MVSVEQCSSKRWMICKRVFVDLPLEPEHDDRKRMGMKVKFNIWTRL